MLNFLFLWSDTRIFLFLTVVFVCISLLGVWLVKRFLPLHIRYQDDSVIGATSNVVSVIYGVLAGLSALYLFNINTSTSDAVQREANSLADVYRNSRWIAEPARSEMKQDVLAYLQTILKIDWPEMTVASMVTPEGDAIINKMMKHISNTKENTGVINSTLLQTIIGNIQNLYDARHQRINLSTQGLSPELWEVLLIGTVLTLCMNFLFGMNFYLHITTAIAAAFMTASMTYLLVSLNYPFQGDLIVEPTPFSDIIKSINNDKS